MIVSENCVEYVLTFHAVISLGAVATMANPIYLTSKCLLIITRLPRVIWEQASSPLLVADPFADVYSMQAATDSMVDCSYVVVTFSVFSG